jgi:hemoglobin
MDTSPEAAKIRAFHAKSLKQSRQKLFMFLSGWSQYSTLHVNRLAQAVAEGNRDYFV